MRFVSALLVFLGSCSLPKQENMDYMPPVGKVGYEGIVEKSYSALHVLVENGEADAEQYFRFSRFALELGHYEEALSAVNASIEKGGQDASKSFLKARILARQGKIKEAIWDGENAAALNMENPEFYAFMASLYFDVDSLRLANEYLDESLYIAPGWVTALQMKARVLMKAGNLDGARQVMYQAIANDKENVESHRLLAQVYLKVPGRLDSALSVNRRGLALTKQYSEGLMQNLAHILERLGRNDSALKVYQAMQAKPHKEFVLGQMAELYLRDGAYTKASQHFVEQIKERPEEKKFYFRAAESFEHLGRLNDAQEIYLKGQKLFPDDQGFKQAYERMSYKLKMKYRSVEL